jgi:hypothetical protein
LAIQEGPEFGKTRLTLQKNGQKEEEIIENDTGFKEEFTDFYLAVRKGQKVKSPFSEAYHDLHIIISALESAKRWDSFELNT